MRCLRFTARSASSSKRSLWITNFTCTRIHISRISNTWAAIAGIWHFGRRKNLQRYIKLSSLNPERKRNRSLGSFISIYICPEKNTRFFLSQTHENVLYILKLYTFARLGVCSVRADWISALGYIHIHLPNAREPYISSKWLQSDLTHETHIYA